MKASERRLYITRRTWYMTHWEMSSFLAGKLARKGVSLKEIMFYDLDDLQRVFNLTRIQASEVHGYRMRWVVKMLKEVLDTFPQPQ